LKHRCVEAISAQAEDLGGAIVTTRAPASPHIRSLRTERFF
jgi:hypothetical protein